MNRALLTGLLVAVIGAAVYFFIRGGDDGEKAKATASQAPERDLPPAAASRTPSAPTRDTTAPPTLDPDLGQRGDELATDGTRIYQREDGSEVRDHRAGNPAPYIRPALPHPSKSPIIPTTTAKVMGLIRGPVVSCMKSVPDAAFGTKPLVMMRATVSIDDQGTLTVQELGPALQDIDAAAAASALDCIRAASGTLSTHVDDQPSVESANLAFPIEPLKYR